MILLFWFAQTIAARRYKQMTISQKNGYVSVVIRELGLARHTASKTLTGGRLRSCESRLRQVQL